MKNRLKVEAICSIARHVPLSKQIEISDSIPAREGVLVVGKIINEKKRYTQLETASSRVVRMRKGDSYVFVLGNRSALDGFVGHVPKQIRKGDILQVLSLGGLCGSCTSTNLREVGYPYNVQITGVVQVQGRPANISDYGPVKRQKALKARKNLILVFGTAMNVGKTHAAQGIVNALTQQGKKVAAAKLTGAGAMKDTLLMKKAGACQILDMVDAGLASTVTQKDTLAAARGIVNTLALSRADYIVLEIGDGLIGKYHGRKILYDIEFQNKALLGIGCAKDLTGAWGLKTLARRHGCRLDLISGPVTDNSAGSDYIEKRWKIPSLNAKNNKTAFEEKVISLLLK